MQQDDRAQIVLHICDDAAFASVFVMPLIEGLRRLGVEASLWTNAPRPGTRLEVEPGASRYARAGISSYLHWNPVVALYRFLKLAREFARYRPTVVHSHIARSSCIPLLAARLTRVPTRIYHNHGFSLTGYSGVLWAMMWLIERWNCRLATHVITVSPGHLEVAVAARIAERNKIRVLGSGSAIGIEESQIRARRWRREGQLPVIGFVGRAHARKGLPIASRAVSLMGDNGVEVLLIVAGMDQSQADNLTDCSGRVRAQGYLSNAQMIQFYESLDLLVVPSWHEGFGQCVIEAAAVGVPSVASDIPGLRSAICNDRTGWLFPVKDVNALVSLLTRLLGEQGAIERAGIAAQERVRVDFTRERILSDLRTLYEEVGMDASL